MWWPFSLLSGLIVKPEFPVSMSVHSEKPKRCESGLFQEIQTRAHLLIEHSSYLFLISQNCMCAKMTDLSCLFESPAWLQWALSLCPITGGVPVAPCGAAWSRLGVRICTPTSRAGTPDVTSRSRGWRTFSVKGRIVNM